MLYVADLMGLTLFDIWMTLNVSIIHLMLQPYYQVQLSHHLTLSGKDMHKWTQQTVLTVNFCNPLEPFRIFVTL